MPTILITGSTDGIGLETARQLLSIGTHVIVHGRSQEKADATRAELLEKFPKSEVSTAVADLASLRQVRAMADEVSKSHSTLDGLINNAGVFMNEFKLSQDGFEVSMAVNHYAPFLLTHLLLPALEKAPQGRIVNVSSVAHNRGKLSKDDLDFKKSFTPYGAYAGSKLANLYFTHELARRLAKTRVTVNALHPGVITTKLLKTGFGMNGGASLESGAKTSVYCVAAQELANKTGGYYSDCAPEKVASHANDPEFERFFYEESCKRVGISPVGQNL